jgi:alkanesulfonate monooxygenase SsuD/methylene tetrahydromethanopterin reductase-like flavin-dependent oxidoreductase (luciferase family)
MQPGESPVARGNTVDPKRKRPLKVGAFIPIVEREMDGGTARGADVLAMARAAEAAGFDSVWIPDHLCLQDPGREPQGAWECGSLLGALAVATSRVAIGTLVVATSFRNPTLLAKLADTVDELSGGRLILGLGSGRHEPEYRAFGYPFDRVITRFEEALKIVTTLLREGRIDHRGEFYEARECELRPRGPRPGGPPILIGALGTGPRMLRLVAQHADLWNAWLTWGRSYPDAIPPLRAKVDAACAAAGRDPATLGRTVALLVEVPGQRARLTSTSPADSGQPLQGTAEEIAEALRGFAREGVAHVQLVHAPNTAAGIEAFAPVLEILDRG